MSDLGRRVATALVLIPLAVGAVVLGGWAFAGFLALTAALAQWEFYGLAATRGHAPLRAPAIGAGVVAVAAFLWPPAVALVVLLLLVIVLAELFRSSDDPLASAAIGVAGVFYPAALLGWYVHLRVGAAAVPEIGSAGAIWLTATILVAIWSADTFAYFTGRAIGKRPLLERVSPNKTIEGTIGGVAGAVLVAMLLKLLVLPFLPWYHALVVGLIAGTTGPLGDLIESRLKRAAEVKDSGSLLPGHGGVLDRIDAMVVAGPLAVIYLAYVAGIY